MERIDDIKKLSQILSDETRLKIIMYLLNQSATVNDISVNLFIDQPRVSSHLAILFESELVSFNAVGRQRVYHLKDKNKITHLLESLYFYNKDVNKDVPKRSKQAEKLVQENNPLRIARTCYDHLAGVQGVNLLNQLLDRGWIGIHDSNNKPSYVLTDIGRENLLQIGVKIDQNVSSKRKFAYGCLDWTERTYHLGGLLGSEILKYLENNKFISRQKNNRVVIINRPINALFAP